MKAFILVVLLAGATAGGTWIYRQANAHLCRVSGYDGMKGDLCVYHSRYVNLEYTVNPDRARNWMGEVRGYEEEYRRHKR